MFPLTAALLISLGCYAISFPPAAEKRLEIFLPLMLLHLAAGVGYWVYAQSNPSDANLYWEDPYGLASSQFAFGTTFTIQFVHYMRSVFSGGQLAYFILFQAFGFIGITLLIRTFTEVGQSLGVEPPPISYLILFLPGLHFWTSAIGKDAPLFMAVSLAVWSSLRIQKRFVWFGVALAVMVLFRIHIAAFACIALAAAFLFDPRFPTIAKALLAPAVVGGAVYVTVAAQEEFGLTSLTAGSLTNFAERTQGLGEQFGGGAELDELSFPLKLLTLLFRPFFFDAEGPLGLIVSVENLVLVGVVGFVLIRLRTLLRLARSVPYVAFCLIFAVTLIVLLAMINYNVGLGLRQKMMAMPAILTLFVTLLIYGRFLASPPSRAEVLRARGNPAAAE